jgi:protocatechuate 3,4-dioxygenase, beta subunit
MNQLAEELLENLTRRTAITASLSALAIAPACAQQPGRVRPNLYSLEDGEHSLEWDERTLAPRTRIAPRDEPGEPFTFTGRVLSADRGEPAAGVVIQAYHTDRTGIYPWGGEPRRITMRAWTRTGADGRYTFDTIKPGIYPSRIDPAHVHMTVIEPGRRPYYIDNIVFEGEFGVTSEYRAKQELRGGSGIVRLRRENGILQATRDIRLERHPA